MLSLPGVTLICVDTANPGLALRAMRCSMQRVRFARALLLSEGTGDEPGIEWASVPDIRSREDYSQFVVKRLHEFVDTPHALLIQWDGFVVNPEAWTDEFLAHDYIGAKWFWHKDGMNVGNGGFSLRSRRLLEALSDPGIVVDGNEDELICRRLRPLLEARHGIRFAPEALADRFSFEADYPAATPFGFHGLFNFWRVLPADELPGLCEQVSDAIARSPQFEHLARNYANLGRWQEATRVLRRACRAAPERAGLAELLANCERSAATAPAARRNEPCPCGSGRRYKHCHGAEGGKAVPGGGSAAIGAALPGTAPSALSSAGQAASAAEPAARAAPSAAPASPAPAAVPPELARALGLHQQGHGETAEPIYRRMLAEHDHPLAEHFLGVLLYQRGDLKSALPLLARSTARAPQVPDFHMNLGVAHLADGDAAAAVQALEQTLRLNPAHAGALNNLGLALQAQNRLPQAINAYRAAIARVPDHAEAHWNLGLALLAAGAFAEGWNEYEWRLRIPALAGRDPPSALPRWDGRPQPGLRLLLRSEQGLGDAIQFARFVPQLAQAGVRVQLECRPELRRLFGSLAGVDRLLDRGEPSADADAVCHLLSLPRLLGVDADSIPAPIPYLSVAPREIDVWRSRLREAQRERPAGNRAVGIAWAGNKTHSNDRNRSCPFERVAALVRVPGVNLVSLQVGDAPASLRELAARGLITDFTADLRDLQDTAGLVSALDAVVSVDTSVAHLAGALGKPVIVMLPFAADWRWQLERDDSVWYPSAVLVRPSEPRNWESVIEQVERLLTGSRGKRSIG